MSRAAVALWLRFAMARVLLFLRIQEENNMYYGIGGTILLIVVILLLTGRL